MKAVLVEGSENYGPETKSTYHVFLQIKLFWNTAMIICVGIIYSYSILHWQSWVIGTEILWPVKSTIFTNWYSQKRVCWPYFRLIRALHSKVKDKSRLLMSLAATQLKTSKMDEKKPNHVYHPHQLSSMPILAIKEGLVFCNQMINLNTWASKQKHSLASGRGVSL